MKTGTLAAGLAALTLATAPIAANAAQSNGTASTLQRSATPVEGEGFVGEYGLIWGLLGVAAIIIGIILITDDDDDVPVSP